MRRYLKRLKQYAMNCYAVVGEVVKSASNPSMKMGDRAYSLELRILSASKRRQGEEDSV